MTGWREPADEVVHSDVVVVGGGVAGLSVAAEIAAGSVTLVTKAGLGQASSTGLAQGGIAAALDPHDSPAEHAADTLAVSEELGDPSVVERLTADGPGRVLRLIQRGARFEHAANGGLALGREGGHRRRRIAHAGGDATGGELLRLLVEEVSQRATVRVMTGVSAQRLLLDDQSIVCGVLAVTTGGRILEIRAGATVLATGGVGGLYRHTTNPPEVIGDGSRLAAQAGARLVDLEFVQFHPTALAVGTDPLPLLTEALRGEGALIVDDRGDRFLCDVHPDAELAPRDVVARAIWRWRAAAHNVFLDLRPIHDLERRFPTAMAACRRHGLDPSRQPLPISPAAHYHMGGIAVDLRGRTSVPRLWACGEVAGTGAHGANRLASNSLLEGLVFGAHVAHDVVNGAPVGSSWPQPSRSKRPGPKRSGPRRSGQGARPDDAAASAPVEDTDVVTEVRRLLWQHVGLVRDEAGLRQTAERLAALAERRAPPHQVFVARLITQAALARCESRGAHHRSDHPRTDPAWRRHLFTTVDEAGEPSVAFGPLLPDEPSVSHPLAASANRRGDAA